MDQVLAGLQSALEGRYVLERQLGRGGMATVYLAQDLKHGRSVALKILHPELAASLGPERFLREIRTTAQLRHPHILPVHDSGEAAGQLWYTMPYVEGESLRDRLIREKQLPLDDAVQIARNVLAALAYAHSHGVIHRDIKPENILLEGDEAVVADFGIARAISAAGTEPLTQTGMSVGTPAYMSPEQAAGGSELDGRSDLYSVGCVLYEMLAGEPPYTGPSPQAIMAKRFLEPVPHVRTMRESVPEAVEWAVTKALAKVPADRFQTARQFTEALALPTVATPTATLAAPSAARPAGPDRRPRIHRKVGLGLALFLAAAGGFWAWQWRHGRPHPASPKMLAVLPFENLGRPEDEYFADGLTEEITSRLASVRDLGVISRTSAMQYKKTAKPLKQIGRELGAGYVLEGSVRWEKLPSGASRVRVTPQLIDVSDDRHLWADRYDADLTDVFQVQGSISEKVMGALDVALRGSERAALAERPTENIDAYTFYLRGDDYAFGLASRDDQRHAVEMYERAVALDPRFALAYAKLSERHSWIYLTYQDPTEQRLAKAKAAADTALHLRPDLPEAHLALGYYYYRGRRDYGHALSEFAIAQAHQANNSDLLLAIGSVQRRQGHWTEALTSLRRAAELDPRAVIKVVGVATTELFLRDYAGAVRYVERCITLAPEEAGFYALKAFAYLAWDGTPPRGLEVVREARSKVRFGDLVYQLNGAGWGGEVVPLLAEVPWDSVSRISAGDYLSDTANYFSFKSSLYRLHHQPALERAYADSGRRVWEAQEKDRPDDPGPHNALGFIYAQLGRKVEAIREGQRAVELLPVSKDALLGPKVVDNLAQIYMIVGEPDAAIDRLEYLLSIPSLVSVGLLRADPLWDPLRGNQRFQRLLGGRQ